MHRARQAAAVGVHHLHPAGSHDRDIAVLELNHVAGPVQDGGLVRGDEVLVLAQADQRRLAQAGRHDLAGLVVGDGRDGADALDVDDRATDGFFERVALPAVAANQQRQGFGSAGGFPARGAVRQTLPQSVEVAGVAGNGDQDAPLGQLGSWRWRWSREVARDPAGVPHAERAANRLEPDGGLQVAQSAGRVARLHALGGADGEPGRVVAAVFEPPETVEYD